MVPGTRNFFFSMSGRSERGAFSQITGMRSGYLAKMRLASALRFSNGTASWSALAAIAKGHGLLSAGLKLRVQDAAA
eukprot:CAMPEP_0179039434 /NCGR_PEP_ID=MMETSP0796-20121207/15139_1 /TAXON_ID=73915 /ORGANISM="Pyrodinium bahamense, Strain pbaha01" /LENGTH=76 /DNA_ID=CAMNT_0020735767 /DNA_START=344 /DNA_END=574 /DNA_ORIENTATION=-